MTTMRETSFARMFCSARRFNVLFGFGFGEHLFGLQNKCFVRTLGFVSKTFVFGEQCSVGVLTSDDKMPEKKCEDALYDPGYGLHHKVAFCEEAASGYATS